MKVLIFSLLGTFSAWSQTCGGLQALGFFKSGEEHLEIPLLPEMVALDDPRLNWSEVRISRTEVTWAQYLRAVDSGVCDIPKDVRGQSYSLPTLPRDNFPVVGIDFDDANCFASWLSQQLGKSFRLPSSEEYDELLSVTGVTTFEQHPKLGKQQDSSISDPREPIGNLKVNYLPGDSLGLQGLSDNVLEFTSTVVSGEDNECFPRPSPCQRVVIRGRFPGVPLGDSQPLEGTLFYTFPTRANSSIGFRLIED